MVMRMWRQASFRVLFGVLAVCACLPRNAEGTMLRLAHPYPQGSAEAEAIAHVAETVRGQDDSIEIEIYAGGALGPPSELVAMAQKGMVDLAVATSSLARTIPQLGVVDLPFLIQDRTHLERLFDSSFLQRLDPRFEANNLKLIGLLGGEFSQITSTRPIYGPDDFKGLKIRFSGVSGQFLENLGAYPVAMAFSELYPALERGVIDAQENSLTNTVRWKFYEVQSNVALTGHSFTPMYLIANLESWAELSDETQDAFIKAVNGSRSEWFAEAEQREADAIEALTEAGVGITRFASEDRERFIEASRPVYDAFAYEVEGGAELVEEALNLADGMQ